MTIGARLRRLRLENKLSQEKFGELCGVTKGMVSQWESDTSTPPTDRLVELKKRLQFSFDWLISGTPTTYDDKIASVVIAMQNMPEYKKDVLMQMSAALSEQPKPDNHNKMQ